MRWQRILRPAFGLFAVGFAVWVYVSIAPKPKAPGNNLVRTDDKAISESTKGQSFMFKGSGQDVRIDYERMFAYQSGRLKFVGAHISVAGRAGRDFLIDAKEAEIAENQSQIDLKGAVVITTSDGLTVKTETATYTESDGVTRAPGAVTFARARMKGSSNGASYDRNRDVLWMLNDAHVTVAPDEKGEGGADVVAGAAGYAKRDRYIRFERGVKMTRGTQVMQSDGAVVTLKQEADVVQQIELRGSSQVGGVGTAANGLEAMRSRDMNLGVGADGQTLQQATLIGDALVKVAGGPTAPGQQLTSQAIDIELGTDGQTVQGLSAQDDVQLDLPAAPNAPARHIRSRALDADGEPGQPGLRSARFDGDVEFKENQPAVKDAPAVERIVRAPKLDMKLQSGLGTINQATFTEGVTVKDGTRTAQGPTMIYDVVKGSIAMAALQEGTGFVQVSDERVNIEARAIDWALDGTRMVAETNVKSVLKPGAGGADGKAVKRPSMLTADQPINVTAASMTYNQQTGHAEYTGDAQLWQGATSIRAKSITLDDATGNLTAKDNVRSVMRVEAKSKGDAKTDAKTDVKADAAAKPATPAKVDPAKTDPAKTDAAKTDAGKATAGKSDAGKPGTKPAAVGSDTIATANELLYEDSERRAKYTGTARMVGEQGDLRGERLELYFDESGHELSRLEGYDNVRFQLKAREATGPRWGNGVRLTYFAEDDRYVLSGPRATVVEQFAPTQCRETTGRSLTFFSSTDSVVVDSDNNSRTLTQTGTTCTPPTP